MAVFRFFKMADVRHLGFIKNGRHRGSPILDSKYVLTTLHSNKIEIITRKINFPYPKTPETWSYTRFYDFWLSGYCRVRLRNAAILDLSKMADMARLPREIGIWWSYLTLVQKWCLWNNLNNHGVNFRETKPHDYPQILSTEDSFYIYEKPLTEINVIASFWALNLRIKFWYLLF